MAKDTKGEERRSQSFEGGSGRSKEGRSRTESWEGRSDRGERSERGERGERSERGERGERGESWRGEAGERGEGREGQRQVQRYGAREGRQEGGWLQPYGWRYSPFSFMRRFSEDMDRLFEDFWGGGGLTRRGELGGFMRGFGESFWVPQVEAFERDGELVVRADLPGVSKDDVQVELGEDSITIRGQRREERERNEEGWYESERSYGSFVRTIPLPEGVNAEKAKANFENGVLEIRMPAPKQPQRGRRIEIQGGAVGGKKGAGREREEAA